MAYRVEPDKHLAPDSVTAITIAMPESSRSCISPGRSMQSRLEWLREHDIGFEPKQLGKPSFHIM